MKRWFKLSWPIGLISMGLLLVAAGVWFGGDTAQAETPVMKLVPASQTVDISDGNFTVDIVIENVYNLASYEFKLKFDPTFVRLVGVENGSFLGSSGRMVQCQSPILSYPAPGAPADTLRFGCATPDPSPPGPNGSGVLATVTLAPRKAGTSFLQLTASDNWTGITDVSGDPFYVVEQSGEVTVVGSGPEPTPEPDEPTPIPTQQAPPPPPTATPGGPSWLTPEPGETPMARPASGDDSMWSGSNRGAGTTTDGSGAEGTAGASGASGSSPRAGTGPPSQETVWWPTLLGGLLAAGGATLLALAVSLQRAGSRRRIRQGRGE